MYEGGWWEWVDFYNMPGKHVRLVVPHGLWLFSNLCALYICKFVLENLDGKCLYVQIVGWWEGNT